MKKFFMLFVSVIFSASLVGCENTSINKQDVGMLTGGALGGVLGNQIGGGTGRVIATVGGTLVGAYLGGAVGKNMDDVDRMKMNSALENTRTGQTSGWINPDSGSRYAVTPTNTYYSGGRPCRDYTTTAVIGGKRETVYGRACRRSDGSWQATN